MITYPVFLCSFFLSIYLSLSSPLSLSLFFTISISLTLSQYLSVSFSLSLSRFFSHTHKLYKKKKKNLTECRRGSKRYANILIQADQQGVFSGRCVRICLPRDQANRKICMVESTLRYVKPIQCIKI